MKYEIGSEGGILLTVGEMVHHLELSEFSFDIKVLAAVEGIVGRLRAAKDPEATLALIQKGTWPRRRSAKPKLLPARVEAVMSIEGVSEQEARDYLESIKGGKLKPEIMAEYHRIMAGRLKD